MNSLATRAKQHKYKNSKIHEHFVKDHDTNPTFDIANAFTIKYRNQTTKKTKLAEALLIRKEKPMINVRFNELATGLNVFK